MPALRWEVTNQATVHDSFANNFGQVVPPLRSLEEGVATWPEFATCGGVKLDDRESIGVVAPHGLDDLLRTARPTQPAQSDRRDLSADLVGVHEFCQGVFRKPFN